MIVQLVGSTLECLPIKKQYIISVLEFLYNCSVCTNLGRILA